MKATTRFLVLLFAAPALAGEATPAPRAKDVFDAPVRLKAGDVYVDTGKYVAHAGPLLYDYDGDGKPDLLVGNFMGHVQVFRNNGTRESPVYEDKGLLQADGKDVKIPNW